MRMSRTIEFRTHIPAPVQALVAFHEDPEALRRLTMPPMRMGVVHDDRVSLTEGRIAFVLWLGPIPVRWEAEHAPGPTPTSFSDRMLRGPLAAWEHQHIFEPAEQGAWLIDRITLKHRPGVAGWLTRLVFDGLPLRLLFLYRHWITRRAVTR